NGDGVLDVVSEHGSTLTILTGNGDGSLTANADVLCGPSATDIALADVDGNGKLDVVSARYGPQSIDVVLQTTAGTWGGGEPIPVGGEALESADFDEDGRIDIAALETYDARLSLELNRGPASLWRHIDFPIPPGDPYFSYHRLVAGDLNGDGHADVAFQ